MNSSDNSRFRYDNKDSRQFIDILYDIQGLKVTADTTHQIELIIDNQYNPWLDLSLGSTLTVTWLVYQAAAHSPDGGNPVGPNTPLLEHYWNYLLHSQF